MNRLHLIGAAAFVLFGVFIAYYMFAPEPPKPETYAPAAVQEDRSQILERKPQANAKPAHKVPKGAKVERVVKLEVRSKPVNAPSALQTAAGEAVPPAGIDCPPVQVDLSLVRLPDESRRVIASSPNGEILTGVDIPVETAAPYKELKWAAGLTANPIDRTLGGFIDRDMGPLRLGAEVNQIRDGFDLRLKAGIRF